MIADKKRKILEKSMCENSLLIMIGKSEQLRNGDVNYLFRQDSDFLLLTGANSPDMRLVGVRENGAIRWTLYSDEITEREKIWGTERLSQREIVERSGIIDVRELCAFREDLEILATHTKTLYIRKTDENRVFRGFGKYREKYTSLEPLLSDLRLMKLPEEIEKIRKAISITHEAYDAIQEFIRTGIYEYEIEAEIARVYRSHHATEAYPTIVASGKNACTLHYSRHERMLEAGDLVLVDFGAEYEGYASDITRVFSVGEMSYRQRAVYESVLRVKQYAESLIRPWVEKSDYEKQVREKMNEELVGLGLVSLLIDKGGRGDLVPESLSRKYYPHSTSHFLGLDVHDVGSREEILKPGMIITCEPGIYIPEEGIGIRLEDDILVTEDGCENLSREIPF